MSGFLDANEIEKLFARASEGNMPMESEERQGRRARWLRTVDFTRPTKFTTDQERRFRRAKDTYTERAAPRRAPAPSCRSSWSRWSGCSADGPTRHRATAT